MLNQGAGFVLVSRSIGTGGRNMLLFVSRVNQYKYRIPCKPDTVLVYCIVLCLALHALGSGVYQRPA